VVGFSAGTRDFLFVHSAQTCSGAHPGSYSMGSGVKKPRRGNDRLPPSTSRIPGTTLQLRHTSLQHRENFTLLWTCILRSKPDGRFCVTYIHCLLDEASRRRPVSHASSQRVPSSSVLLSHFRTTTQPKYKLQLLFHVQGIKIEHSVCETRILPLILSRSMDCDYR
jgi:hypothetical protein